MKTALSANTASLARVVSMPTCRATVSSAPMTRSASPSRERTSRPPTRKTSTASAKSCQKIASCPILRKI
jgi:hypothetical protein